MTAMLASPKLLQRYPNNEIFMPNISYVDEIDLTVNI